MTNNEDRMFLKIVTFQKSAKNKLFRPKMALFRCQFIIGDQVHRNWSLTFYIAEVNIRHIHFGKKNNIKIIQISIDLIVFLNSIYFSLYIATANPSPQPTLGVQSVILRTLLSAIGIVQNVARPTFICQNIICDFWLYHLAKFSDFLGYLIQLLQKKTSPKCNIYDSLQIF